MEMLYINILGTSLEHGEHGKAYENMRKEKKRVDDDW